MATMTQTPTRSDGDAGVEQKIQRMRELYADAPEVGKTAHELKTVQSARESWP